MSDNNNNNITSEAAAAVSSSTARQGVTTSTSSATSTSLASSLNLAPFVASVLRDKVVADLHAENTRLNEQLAAQTAIIERVRTDTNDAEEEFRAQFPNFMGLMDEQARNPRPDAEHAAMIFDQLMRDYREANDDHDNAMDGDDTADLRERDDGGANDDHDNTMDGDDTPTLNISLICVVSIILYGIFLWIDRWEYRRLTTE